MDASKSNCAAFDENIMCVGFPCSYMISVYCTFEVYYNRYAKYVELSEFIIPLTYVVVVLFL